MRSFRTGLCGLCFLLCGAALSSAQKVNAPIVVLVGLDGFRWDYLDKYHPPTLTKLAADGVRAERMIPSFPSLTFPNFYTLATGLRPEHHGIVNNSMFDPEAKETFTLSSLTAKDGKWWGGQPIWVTAEKQGLHAGCMFWPGAEAEIDGVRPSEWRPYSDAYPPMDRVKSVLEWLGRPTAERPRLVTIYFHEVDTAGHAYAPDSPETGQAVGVVDAALAELLAGVDRLGLLDRTNFVVVADHGMAEVSGERIIGLCTLLDLKTVQVEATGSVAGLRPQRQEDLNAIYDALAAKQEHFQVFRREEMPEEFHYRASPRIPPIILLADEGWTIARYPLKSEDSFKLKGSHGFDPRLVSMGATFIAEGPSLRKGVVIPPFDNIHVYNLLCALLKIKPAPNDGDEQLVKECLAP
ncbi:ectonucleotide pyrophosphatase/phosphodiesterase [soil metagenome]